jgi:hypothetical protein
MPLLGGFWKMTEQEILELLWRPTISPRLLHATRVLPLGLAGV